METGASMQVPLFIEPGDVVRIDTRTPRVCDQGVGSMPACDVGLSDLSLRCLGKLDPPSLASWSNLAPALEALDGAGFHSIEAWGEMTFDHSLRALRVSPWDRLAALSRYITRTPLQLELRGRCLLGSRVYPDDTVKDFIAQASDCGIRSFLIAEPLDDLGGDGDGGQRRPQGGWSLDDGPHVLFSVGRSGGLVDGHRPGSAQRWDARRSVSRPPKPSLRAPSQILWSPSWASISLPVQVHLEAAGGFGPAAAAACVAAGASVVYGSCAPSLGLDRSSLGFPALLPVLRDSARLVELDEDAAVAAGIALAGVALRGGEPLRASRAQPMLLVSTGATSPAYRERWSCRSPKDYRPWELPVTSLRWWLRSPGCARSSAARPSSLRWLK